MGYDFEHLDVLVVHESESMRTSLHSALKSLRTGRVRMVADCIAAQGLIREDPPGLVITGWRMQPLDGLAFVRWLRGADSPDRFVPAIMVAAVGDAGELADAGAAGLHDVLVEPVTRPALRTSIATVLGEPLPFIRTRGYFGPERRRSSRAVAEERRVPAATPCDRASVAGEAGR